MIRNKREAEPDFFNLTVDVLVHDTTSSKPAKTRPMNCRVTPKRIYTPGGAVFDRQSGRQILSKAYAGATWIRRALPETLRPEQLPRNP